MHALLHCLFFLVFAVCADIVCWPALVVLCRWAISHKLCALGSYVGWRDYISRCVSMLCWQVVHWQLMHYALRIRHVAVA
jgi:hypothetical protein